MPEMITLTSSGNCLTWACSPARCWWSTAFSKVRPVEGRPEGLIAALRESVRAGRYAGDARHDRGRRPPL